MHVPASSGLFRDKRPCAGVMGGAASAQHHESTTGPQRELHPLASATVWLSNAAAEGRLQTDMQLPRKSDCSAYCEDVKRRSSHARQRMTRTIAAERATGSPAAVAAVDALEVGRGRVASPQQHARCAVIAHRDCAACTCQSGCPSQRDQTTVLDAAALLPRDAAPPEVTIQTCRVAPSA